MNNTAQNKKKKTYISPELITVQLDNDISLSMESEVEDPPFGPDEYLGCGSTFTGDAISGLKV
jgi:hypothetical protein